MLGLCWAWCSPGRYKILLERVTVLASVADTHLSTAAPHNYINFASLKMLISPVTHFRLTAIVPTSPRFRGLARDSHASTSSR